MVPLCVCGVWAAAAQPQVLAVAFAGPEWESLGKTWANVGGYAADPRYRQMATWQLRFARYSLNTLVYRRKSDELGRQVWETRKLPEDRRIPRLRLLYAEQDALVAAREADIAEFRQLVEIIKERAQARQAEIDRMTPPPPR